MDKNLQRAWAEVNLDNIAHNLKKIRKITGENVKIMAVVKADAYGHGVFEVAKTAISSGADYLAVACIDEAIQLRSRNIDVPLLILGNTPAEYACNLVDYKIVPTVFDTLLPYEMAKYAVGKGVSAKIHVKVDTGMSRIGFEYLDNPVKCRETSDTIAELSQIEGIELEGVFTHFARADEKDGCDYTNLQFERFTRLIDDLESRGIHIPLKHACNSAATVLYKEMHLNMVRVGIIMYGHYPSDYVGEMAGGFAPAMELKARITCVKEIQSGTPVSYGGIYTAPSPRKIATVPIGYADGYSRGLSNRARVLIDGSYAPVVGRVCMDQMMVDATGIDVNYGDTAVLIGTSGNNTITAEELADLTGVINYEVLCIIGKRIPRAYIKSSKIENIIKYVK